MQDVYPDIEDSILKIVDKETYGNPEKPLSYTTMSLRDIRDVNGLPPKNRIQKEENIVKICIHSSEPDLSEYESMTKEELIQELVKSRINEARLPLVKCKN